MPIPSSVILPKTRDNYEFENMVADVLSRMYCKNFQTFGRRGQKQYGIDVLANDSLGIVAQCKNFDLTTNIIDKILDDFILYKEDKDIKNLIIATNMDCDTHMQLYINQINTSKKYNFNISIIFWDCIQAILYQHPDLFQKYYGNDIQNKVTINDLKATFNQALKDHLILNFLIRDIFVDGVPTNLPTEAECFSTELIQLLYKNLELQNEDIYKAIMNFCDTLNKLNGYLGLQMISSPDSRIYRYVPDLHKNDTVKRQEISKNISAYMKMLDCFYGKINSGMTLFP